MLRRLVLWLLLLVTVLVYAPHLSNGYVAFDDNGLIYENPAVKRLTVRTLHYIFTSYDPELYVPLTLLSYQIENVLFGLHPTVTHTINLLLHLGNIALLYIILRRLTGREALALGAATLFALHPIQTEAVLWAAARKDLLASIFFLGSLLLWLRYREEERRGLYLASVALFLLGLLSKVSIISLPLVLLLSEWVRGRRIDRHILMEVLPFLLLSIVFLIIALIGKTRILGQSDLGTLFLLSCKSTLFYIQNILVPRGFSVVYPQETLPSLWTTEFALSIAGVCALLLLTLYGVFRHRALSACILFYLLLLAPNFTNFTKNGFLFVASDRYVYLASIGLFLLIAAFLLRLGSFWRRGVQGIVVVGIVFLVWRTSLQAATWQNTLTLFQNVLHFYPSSAMAHNNVGVMLLEEGKVEEARTEFEASIALDPDRGYGYRNIAYIQRTEGKTSEAEATYRMGIAALDQAAVLQSDDLMLYFIYGEFLEEQGRRDEALALFEEAVARGNDLPETHFNLGIKYHERERYDDAIRELTFVTDQVPMHSESHYHLAAIYGSLGRLEDARKELQIVLSLDPGHTKAREHLEGIERMLRR